MGIPWKKLAMVGKFLPGIDNIIESVEGVLPGNRKKDAVESFNDVVVESSQILAGLSPEDQIRFKLLRSDYIDAYVAYRNAASLLADFVEDAEKRAKKAA